MEKFLHYFKSATVWLFLAMTVFVNFGFIQEASAACSYSIRFGSPQSTVNRTGNLNLTLEVSKAGTSGSCANSITVVVSAKASFTEPSAAGPTTYDSLELFRRDLSFNNSSTIQQNWAYSLSGIDWRKIPDQNKLELTARVYAGGTNVVTSSPWPVTVSGTTGTATAGVRHVTISYDRSTYRQDDRINLNIKLDDPSNAKDVEIVTYINGKEISKYNQSAVNLAATQTVAVIVNSSYGFQNGSNTVLVDMFEQNSSRRIKFADGTATGLMAQMTNAAPGGQVPSSPGGTQTGGGNVPSSPDVTGGGNVPSSPGNNPPYIKVDCTRPDADPKNCLYNPLPTAELTTMFLLLAKGFYMIVGVWAVIFIIWSALKMIMAQGNEEAFTAARKGVTHAVIGLVVALLAFSIVQIVQNLIYADTKNEVVDVTKDK